MAPACPDARISVIYFSNSLARGGVEEHILTLLRGLDRGMFRLALACTPEVVEMLGRELPPDVTLFPLCLRHPSHLGAARRLGSIIRRQAVDILHSHLFYSSLFASPIGWLAGVPVIVETPHVREHWRRGWFKRRFVVDRLVGGFVDHFIAVSHANARYLVDEKGIPARKVVVIQNGCDLTRFRRESPAEDLRARHGYGASDPVLIVVGRLEPQKGHRFLIEALPSVLRDFPRARLVCVGDGSLRPELEAQVARRGLDGAVRFVGYQSNVRDWLAMADVTVLPSLYEGLPLVAIEALAAERPVVATDVDGTPEVVLHGRTGFTVPPGDPASLARAIGRLLGDAKLRRTFGNAGRQWVTAHFSEERQVRETQDFYLDALARRRRATWGTSAPSRPARVEVILP